MGVQIEHNADAGLAGGLHGCQIQSTELIKDTGAPFTQLRIKVDRCGPNEFKIGIGIFILLHNIHDGGGIVPFCGILLPLSRHLGTEIFTGGCTGVEILHCAVFGGTLVLVLDTITEFRPECFLFLDVGGNLMGGKPRIPFVPETL